MSEYSQQELEDAKYEIWLESDGPAQAEAKHQGLADATLADLENAGWHILGGNLIRGFEFRVTELVIRRGDDVRIVIWHPGNEEWFTSNGPGGGSSPLRLVLKAAAQEQDERRARNAAAFG